MNPFKSKGFDSLIAPGQTILGDLILAKGSTSQIDGAVLGQSIKAETVRLDGTSKAVLKTMSKSPTTLVINGTVTTDNVEVENVTISGVLYCKSLIVSGTLAIRKGAKVNADVICYQQMIIEPGAIINGNLKYSIQDDSTQSSFTVVTVD